MLGLLTVALAADPPSFPTNEDLRHYLQVASPQLSPDGKRVLVQISDATADGGLPHLWVTDVEGDAPARQLTFTTGDDPGGEHDGAWTPDGDVLFLAHRGEHASVFRLPMNGGEAHPYALKVVPTVDTSTAPDAVPPPKAEAPTPSPVDLDASHFALSPDGKTLAILADDPQTPGEKAAEDAKADAVRVDLDPHGTRLLLLDPATGKLVRTGVPRDVQGVAFAPGSDRLVAVVEDPGGASDLGPANHTWLLTLADPDHPVRLDPIPATVESVAWSADGGKLDFLAQTAADAPPGYLDLFELDLGTHQVRPLSVGLRATPSGKPLPQPDGTVILPVQDGVRDTAARLGSKPEVLAFDLPSVSALATNLAHTGWVWVGSSSTLPRGVYWSDTLGGAGRPLRLPTLVPDHAAAVQSRVLHWKSDRFSIEGLAYVPAGVTRKVPLVVMVHGGPLGAFTDDYSALVAFFLGQGWAVLCPNPRGSTGYGAAFAAANQNDLGGGDYRDLMAGVDAAVAQLPVDPSRLALFGYSYGGEMAGFVEGRTTRFAAIASGAPVIDQYSEYGTEDGSWYDRWYFGQPWVRPADAWRQSPLARVGKAKTPFLLLQGEEDTVDPLGQSQEMYRALKQVGVHVELVQYPRDDHGPLATGLFGLPSPEPWHGFDARQRIVKFFADAFASTGG